MDIVVSGTGRCGTGFMSKWLTSAGIKCTHEGVFNLGGWDSALEKIQLRKDNLWWGWRADSSWLAAPFLHYPELNDMTVIHVVRHPKPTLDSFLRLILYANERPYFDWATRFVPEIKELGPVDSMAYWYIAFNEMVEARADYRYRVEDDTDGLRRFLGINTTDLYSNTGYNSRSGLGPSDIKLADISLSLREKLIVVAQRYGYEWND